MSGFLYFLPSVQATNVKYDTLVRYGVSHIVDSAKHRFHARGCVGPEALQGAIVGVGGHNGWAAEEVKNSEAITWKRFPKTVGPEGLSPWLGWIADGLPTPDQLQREHQLPGEFLTLADGYDWLVPVARDCEGVCKLPIAFDVDDETGKLVANRVRREYEKIWAHAVLYYVKLGDAIALAQASGTTAVSVEIPDGDELVVDVLATNYRVSLKELATLGVFVSGVHEKVADVLIDFHNYGKKK